MHSPHNKLFNVVEAKLIEFLDNLLERTTSFAGNIKEQPGVPDIKNNKTFKHCPHHSKSVFAFCSCYL